MRKMYKQSLAILLAALMTAGTFMVPSSAMKRSDSLMHTLDALASTASETANAAAGKQFTGTADLIQDSIEYVLENGVAPTGGQEDWLAETVEEQSGMTLEIVMTGIFRGITNKENNGYLNTAVYHLDEAAMEAVVERVLEQYYMSNAVTYTLDVVDGEVAGISYEMKEALSIALDEIEVNAATGNDESAMADAVERAEANAAEKYTGEFAGMVIGEFTEEYAGETNFEDEDVCEESEDGKHVYVEVVLKAYMATPATCKEPATYYYTCENCGGHSTETFVDPGNKLAGCTYAEDAEWQSDASGHWKVCTVCNTPAEPTAHEQSEGWESDAEGHWHDCSICGYALDEKVAHTPVLSSSNDEEHGEICEVCAYTLGEVTAHSFDQTVVSEVYLASEATCADVAKYYYSCVCGAKGTETFDEENGELKAHTPAEDWQSNEASHWHICTVCESVLEDTVEEHTPDREEATTENAVICTVCEYEIAPIVVIHEHNYTLVKNVTWAYDYSSCTATFECRKCDAETEGHAVTVTTTAITITPVDDGYQIYADFDTPIVHSVGITVSHFHTFDPNNTDSFSFSWYDYRTVNDDTNGDGPDMSMVYDPTYDAASDPYYDPSTGMGKYVMYEPNTGIGVSVMNKIVIACEGLTIKCTQCDETIHVAGDNPGIVLQTMYLDATGNPTTDPNAIVMEMMTAAYALDENTVFSTQLDAAEYRLKIHWNEMTYFFREHPEYYGTSADFWTSKNTDASPLQAIKVLCNMGDLVFVPNPTMDYMVEMLNQAFISYVMQYGYMLQYAVYDATACLDESMTDIQKMLVMHDWLAKNATFDMQSLVDSKSGESAGADPISFTPFGTLLANQIGTDGAICLGYAAAYNYLLQYAFPEHYRNAEGEWLSPEEADHITDFVQIKFHTNVADSSVAGGNSGFGEGIFNEPHYFNAVRLPDSETGMGSDYWYYVDACYDDISVEVISQYRVETDGNISHMYFLSSPQSFIDQFEGNFDYFDSAYDGYTWVPNYKLDENGEPYMDMETGTLATEKDEDGYTIYTQYQSEDEIMYDDDQFEQTWFSNIVSEIVYDGEYWYYVEGSGGSYASMKDMFGNSNSDQGGNNFQIDSEMMAQYRNDPEYADKLKRRDRVYGDRPEESGNNSNNQFGTSMYEDPYAEVLFHYGYGSMGAPETDNSGNAINGEYYDLVAIDSAFNDKYPDLVHAVALYNNQLYFNLGDRIMIYNLRYSNIAQLKEYTTVHALTNGKRFTGMSFYTTDNVDDAAYTFTVKDHPIAALTINQVVTWERDAQGPVLDENGAPIRHVTPSMYVSIATNYSNSYAVNDVPYVEEAVNYNPNFYRFMQSDEESEEEENENVEFMWCANIVDIMPMEAMLNDLNQSYVTVHEDAFCGQAGFEEPKSPEFGLSDGSEKQETNEAALEHHFIWNETEALYVCYRCKDCVDQTYIDENEVSTGHNESGEPVFVWADDYSSCDIHIGCAVEDCDGKTVYACDVTSEENEEERVIVYTAIYIGENEVVYTDTKEVSTHKHTLTTSPVFTWGEDENGNVTATITFVCTSDECHIENYTETYDCEVEFAEDIEKEEIIYTAVYGDYSDTKVVNVHQCKYGEPVFQWNEDYTSCVAVFTCEKCEDAENVDCYVEQISADAVTGNVTVKASCTFNGEDYAEEFVVVHTEHIYAISEYKWADDYSECSAVFTCTKCSDAIEGYEVIKACSVESELVIQPTAEENGLRRYTASCTFNGEEYTDSKEVTVSAYGEITLNVSDLRIKSNNEAQMVIEIDSLPESGVTFLQLAIDYDPAYLTLVSAEATDILGEFVTTSQDITVKPYLVTWDSTVGSKDTGAILTLTFKAADIKKFTEEMSLVSVKCVQCLNDNTDEVACIINDFSTTILIPGDVTGDGIVDGKDLIQLRRYYAEFTGITIDTAMGDVDGNGSVNGADILLMRQYIAGWNVVLK